MIDGGMAGHPWPEIKIKVMIVLRRNDKEIKDVTMIDEIFNQAQICRIAMCSNNIPYLVPMNFGYETGSLYLHSAKEGKKIRTLRENPNVSFEVETMVEIITGEKACNWGMKYLSVIGQGKAEIINDRDEKIKGLDLIMRKYSGGHKFEYSELSIEEIHVIKIRIEELTGKKSGY